jgi:hypothetical protein
MPRLIKPFIIGFIILLLFLSGSFSRSLADTGEININFSGSRISARLKDAPLDQVLAVLKREKGIWFNWHASLADETISMQFKDLSLEEGLNRILSRINHARIFDHNKQLVGLFILGNGGVNSKLIQHVRSENKTAFPFQSNEDIGLDKSAVENSENPFSSAGSEFEPTEMAKENPFSQIESQGMETSNAPFFEVSSSPQQSVSDFSPFPN